MDHLGEYWPFLAATILNSHPEVTLRPVNGHGVVSLHCQCQQMVYFSIPYFVCLSILFAFFFWQIPLSSALYWLSNIVHCLTPQVFLEVPTTSSNVFFSFTVSQCTMSPRLVDFWLNRSSKYVINNSHKLEHMRLFSQRFPHHFCRTLTQFLIAGC